MKTKVFLTGIALMAVTIMANAQNPVGCKGNGSGLCGGTGNGSACVANTKNGAGDNKGASTANTAGKNRTGNGQCIGSGTGQSSGKGGYFVDANKDGACDNNKTGSKK